MKAEGNTLQDKKITCEEDMESGRICSTAVQQEEYKRWVTK